LKTARLLAKHQGFSRTAALGLLRSLAFESLDGARDADQLRRVWSQFDNTDRRDPYVTARAAKCLCEFGDVEEARSWLKPFWERLNDLTGDERAALADALICALPGMGPEWLSRLEAAARSFPRESAVAHAVGCALAERQLWGKARQLLETAATDDTLVNAQRRHAWRTLARLAENEADEARAARCYEAAARLG
jgi:HemY protein